MNVDYMDYFVFIMGGIIVNNVCIGIMGFYVVIVFLVGLVIWRECIECLLIK